MNNTKDRFFPSKLGAIFVIKLATPASFHLLMYSTGRVAASDSQ